MIRLAPVKKRFFAFFASDPEIFHHDICAIRTGVQLSTAARSSIADVMSLI
jgi:hypothetical protein